MSLSNTIESAVQRCVEEVREATMTEVRAILAPLTNGHSRGRRPNGAGRPASSAPQDTNAPVAPKAKRRQSAKQRAANKLQGAYLGLIRQLPTTTKAKIKKLRAAKGVEAAIKAMRAAKK